MADKETTKLLCEAVDFYLVSLRKDLSPTTDAETLKKIVRFEEIKTALLAKKED